MEIISLTVAILAMVVSVVSAIIAGVSLKEQKRISKLTANYTAITAADSLLVKHEELLSLYNIDKELLDKYGIKPVELLYLAESFHAAELYRRIEGQKVVTLSKYRENLLRNEKVRKAWQHFIRGKFTFYAPFTEAIDKFIEQEQAASAKQIGDAE